MVVDIIVSVALYKPLGIAGLVIGTAAANAVMTWLQLQRLRTGFNGRLEGAQTLMITIRILVAAAIAAAAARGVWAIVDPLVGRMTAGQIVSVGLAIATGIALYSRLVLTMRVPEARQIEALIAARLRVR
jgi:putative peptidoglycan lipid II flippase